MIKVGDLVKYEWDDTPGLVVRLDNNPVGRPLPQALVVFPESYSREVGAVGQSWWIPMDRWLVKVS
jgi:hypothetical protein